MYDYIIKYNFDEILSNYQLYYLNMLTYMRNLQHLFIYYYFKINFRLSTILWYVVLFIRHLRT